MESPKQHSYYILLLYLHKPMILYYPIGVEIIILDQRQVTTYDSYPDENIMV
jgi:hypothetical protein